VLEPPAIPGYGNLRGLRGVQMAGSELRCPEPALEFFANTNQLIAKAIPTGVFKPPSLPSSRPSPPS